LTSPNWTALEPIEPIEYVKRAAKRLQDGDRGAAAWEFHFSMSAAAREAFDLWLVATNHPSAMEPGTTERRFCRRVSEEAGQSASSR
jgi:hypothetical protein